MIYEVKAFIECFMMTLILLNLLGIAIEEIQRIYKEWKSK